MKLLRGRHKGETVTLGQFANDWMTVREHPTLVVSPLSVELTPEEVERVRSAPLEHLGMFWSEWELDDGTGRFRRHQGIRERWSGVRSNARRDGL